MINLLTCPKCGRQFEAVGSSARCPECNTRASQDEPRPGSGAFFMDYRSGRGFRTMSFGRGGRSVLLIIAAVLLLPLLLGGGLISLIIGAVFGVGWLATLGAVMSASGAAVMLFLLWKLWTGLRAAASAFQDNGRPWREEDDSIEGRWEQH